MREYRHTQVSWLLMGVLAAVSLALIAMGLGPALPAVLAVSAILVRSSAGSPCVWIGRRSTGLTDPPDGECPPRGANPRKQCLNEVTLRPCSPQPGALLGRIDVCLRQRGRRGENGLAASNLRHARPRVPPL